MPMNPSEMLRRLADIIDGMSNQQSPGGSDTVINQPKANMQPVEIDATDHSDSSTMVSPLQQGFEMMKIATGGAESGAEEDHEEGEICEHCGKGICECDDTPMEGDEDEIAIMRRNAGMQAKRDNAEGDEAAKDAAGVNESIDATYKLEPGTKIYIPGPGRGMRGRSLIVTGSTAGSIKCQSKEGTNGYVKVGRTVVLDDGSNTQLIVGPNGVCQVVG